MPPVIQVKDLGKQYRIGARDSAYATLRETLVNTAGSLWRPKREQSKTIWALRDASFDVGPGEVMGIIGRNGAGKTTLLRILSRITEPTTGRVELHGRVGSLLEVGTGFHPELSGRENIYLNGSILGMRREEIERRFDEIVAFAEVSKFIDTPVKRYSSGMYLRLAFAVAAHLETEILLVDEVLAVGDIQFQNKCMGKIEQVAEQGRTILFVSHNMPAVQRLCNRGLLLSDGQITAEDDVQKVVQAYLTMGLKDSGERVWSDSDTAPGDGVTRLKAIRALDKSMQVRSALSVRDDWYLEVEFWVFAPGQNINVYIYIYNESGNLVFVTGDFQGGNWHRTPRPVGVHKSRCQIPGDLLNTGELRVLVGLVTPPNTLRAIERDAILIRIDENLSTDGSRGFYPNDWPGGVVRPRLTWEYEFTSPEDLSG
jgi:lipopolysaccharide transport system ATP-binding protein